MQHIWTWLETRRLPARRNRAVAMLEYILLLIIMTTAIASMMRVYWRPWIPKIMQRFNAIFNNFPNGG